MLHDDGFETIIFDNLSTGNKNAIQNGLLVEGDLQNSAQINELFQNHNIDAVIHFAAAIAVGESIEQPEKYYFNNVLGTLNLLKSMREHGVNKIIFSSTAAVYGNPKNDLIDENHPKNPINPYGRSKLMIENILKDYDRAYGIKHCSLRYFNAAGGDPKENAKNYNMKASNLIPIILNSLKKETPISIFGTDYDTTDGTCVRDYVHIADLGSAHIAALKKLLSGTESKQYNLGNGQGFTVKKVISSTENVTGKKINAISSDRRPGDPAILVANSEKAKRELGWTPKYSDLESIIHHQWKAVP